eukprot:CAMPEP_0116880626 /NCGR_PEP_ID=MMETSP0463-20121206/12559_1 /TAXON_ID=181622 /ORGANISM="Strombidinopsis sp, Strain SopsisLIS2011" /LENGTH=33 /DNA_ID= /DNA_START= /DNA_END= /DNA_ORIENTATION=
MADPTEIYQDLDSNMSNDDIQSIPMVQVNEIKD